MDIKKLCNLYDIECTDDNVNLDDFAKNVVKSQNIKEYIKTIKKRKTEVITIAGKHYVSHDNIIIIAGKGRSQGCIKFFKTLQHAHNKKNEAITTINANDGIFVFGGVSVFAIIDKIGEIWFKGVDIANILEYKKQADAIRNIVDTSDKKTYDQIKGQSTPKLLESPAPKENTQDSTIMINE